MGYAERVTVHLINSMASDALSVRHAIPDGNDGWGKFYKDGSKDDDVAAAEINRITVAPNSSVNINLCGHSHSSTGTNGSIELWDGETKIAKIYWNCPWGSQPYNFGVSECNDSYWVDQGSWARESGAIGSVDVIVGRKN
ncbi:Asp-hemolysin [Penicillium rolfsii]|nr:Asp-hemolysin [Penicillium rolfsii]